MIFDTDVLIWVQRGNPAARLALNTAASPAISVMTHLELLQGAQDKRHLNALDVFLKTLRFQVLPFSDSTGQLAISLLRNFRLSHSLSSADALIAATAIEHGMPLCSGNTKHFNQIPQLDFKIFKPS